VRQKAIDLDDLDSCLRLCNKGYRPVGGGGSRLIRCLIVTSLVRPSDRERPLSHAAKFRQTIFTAFVESPIASARSVCLHRRQRICIAAIWSVWFVACPSDMYVFSIVCWRQCTLCKEVTRPGTERFDTCWRVPNYDRAARTGTRLRTIPY
jgi:hypothetical protein